MLETYTAQAVRVMDAWAINECGIPGIVLMRRAGLATLNAICQQWPGTNQLTVFCGNGNNAGDGYIIAGLARQRGMQVSICWLGDPMSLSGDAKTAWRWALAQGVGMAAFDAQSQIGQGILVDALLGTGLNGPVRPAFLEAIDWINESGLAVAAVDVPSGLSADTGEVCGAAVRADMTVTFIGRKQGLFTGDGRHHAGRVLFDDLQVPPAVYQKVQATARILTLDELLASRQQRHRNAHKGQFGHLLVVGGDSGMGGAVVMAAIAAARTGAGLVSVATRREHAAAMTSRQPEIMVNSVDTAQDLERLLTDSSRQYTSIVLGPGLGRSAWSEQMMQKVLDLRCPLVMDADALNLLSERKVESRSNWVLTPHPGEAARLLNVSTAEIQSDRFSAARRISSRHGGVTLLKGAGTLIDDGQSAYICPYGNPGMASGGMGDVLSGVIGSLLAQGQSIHQAACLGACLHSRAADQLATKFGPLGLMATDLMPELRMLNNYKTPIEKR